MTSARNLHSNEGENERAAAAREAGMATGVGINESGRSFIIRSMMMHFLRAKEFPRRVFLSCHIQEGLNKHQ